MERAVRKVTQEGETDELGFGAGVDAGKDLSDHDTVVFGPGLFPGQPDRGGLRKGVHDRRDARAVEHVGRAHSPAAFRGVSPPTYNGFPPYMSKLPRGLPRGASTRARRP